MLNTVLDTNVLVSGLLTGGGNPARIIAAVKAQIFNIFYDAGIIAEYRDVLTRPRLGLNPADITELLDVISVIGYPVMAEKSDIDMPDEDDRVFYDAARAASAYLVTGNKKHFLTSLLS